MVISLLTPLDERPVEEPPIGTAQIPYHHFGLSVADVRHVDAPLTGLEVWVVPFQLYAHFSVEHPDVGDEPKRNVDGHARRFRTMQRGYFTL